MKNSRVVTATNNARRTSKSSAASKASKKTAKPIRHQRGFDKRHGPFLRDSARRHTSQKPPLDSEVVELLARRSA